MNIFILEKRLERSADCSNLVPFVRLAVVFGLFDSGAASRDHLEQLLARFLLESAQVAIVVCPRVHLGLAADDHVDCQAHAVDHLNVRVVDSCLKSALQIKECVVVYDMKAYIE